MEDSFYQNDKIVIFDDSAGLIFCNSELYNYIKGKSDLFPQHSDDPNNAVRCKIGSVNYFVTYITSSDNNWKYYKFENEDTLFFEITQLRNAIIFIIMILLVIGLLVWGKYY
jgi:hypothetical protein